MNGETSKKQNRKMVVQTKLYFPVLAESMQTSAVKKKGKEKHVSSLIPEKEKNQSPILPTKKEILQNKKHQN